jgi:hypothetical protein
LGFCLFQTVAVSNNQWSTSMKIPIFRGVIMGGTVGLTASLLFGIDPVRSLILGVLCGLLAVATKVAMNNRKEPQK